MMNRQRFVIGAGLALAVFILLAGTPARAATAAPTETPTPTTTPTPRPTPTCAGNDCLPQIFGLLAAQATREAAYTQLVDADGQVVLLRREYTDAGRAGLLISMATLTLVLAGIAVLILRRSK
jgi:hypothetical protein